MATRAPPTTPVAVRFEVALAIAPKPRNTVIAAVSVTKPCTEVIVARAREVTIDCRRASSATYWSAYTPWNATNANGAPRLGTVAATTRAMPITTVIAANRYHET
jgi:hypothetical protein